MQYQPGTDWWGFVQQRLALENRNTRLSVSECHILENTGLQQQQTTSHSSIKSICIMYSYTQNVHSDTSINLHNFSLFKTGLHFLLHSERYCRKYGLHLRGRIRKKNWRFCPPLNAHCRALHLYFSHYLDKHQCVGVTRYTHCTLKLPGVGDAQGNQQELSLITSTCTPYITLRIFLSKSPTAAHQNCPIRTFLQPQVPFLHRYEVQI